MAAELRQVAIRLILTVEIKETEVSDPIQRSTFKNRLRDHLTTALNGAGIAVSPLIGIVIQGEK